MSNFIANITSGDILAIFRSFGVFYQFGFSIERSCRLSDTNFEMISYCLDKKNGCSLEKIVDNLSKSIFKITGFANRIIELGVNQFSDVSKIDITKPDGYAQSYRELGNSFGELVRGILGYTPNSPQNTR